MSPFAVMAGSDDPLFGTPSLGFEYHKWSGPSLGIPLPPMFLPLFHFPTWLPHLPGPRTTWWQLLKRPSITCHHKHVATLCIQPILFRRGQSFSLPHKPVINVKVEHPVILLSDYSSDTDTQDFDAPSSHFKLRKLPTVQHPVDTAASTLSSFSNFHFVFHEVPMREKKRTLRTPEGTGHPQVTLCIQGCAHFEDKLLLIKWTHVKDFYNVTHDCVEFMAYVHDNHPDLLKFVTNLAALKFQGHFNLNTPCLDQFVAHSTDSFWNGWWYSLKSRTSTGGYFSNSTGSSATSSWVSPFIASVRVGPLRHHHHDIHQVLEAITTCTRLNVKHPHSILLLKVADVHPSLAWVASKAIYIRTNKVKKTWSR